jgi:ribonuclease HII
LPYEFRVGADENGLGARLGPLVVTAVLARVSEQGRRTLSRKLPRAIRADLDDSKRLLSHTNVALGEAWARALSGEPANGKPARSPAELFERLSLEGSGRLRKPCASHVVGQCWHDGGEAFQAEPEVMLRITKHRKALAERGVELLSVRSSVVCTKELNDKKSRGTNRFVADLHAMEALVLELRAQAGSDVEAVCGKVGGIAEYSKFFGPLSGRLHAIMGEGRARSGYRFPGLGEIHFVRDADAADPLVSLSSLIGKYVRELFMSRIGQHYEPRTALTADGTDENAERRPSGYHDPVTAGFVLRSALLRRKRKIPDHCFERERADEAESSA